MEDDQNTVSPVGVVSEIVQHRSPCTASSKTSDQNLICLDARSPHRTGAVLADRQRIVMARKCEEMAVKLADIAADICVTLNHHPGTSNATGQVRFVTEFLREIAHVLSAAPRGERR